MSKNRKKTKMPTGLEAFFDRQKCLGKWNDWTRSRVKATARPGLTSLETQLEDFGFLGDEEEIRQYRKRHGYDETTEKPAAKPVVEVPAAVSDQVTDPGSVTAPAEWPLDLSREQAIATLPDRAPRATEVDWVHNHVAMGRQAESGDSSKPVRVTASDILKAPHGPAPSKAAARLLMHYVNRPAKFFDARLSEIKKAKDEDGAKKAETIDIGLAEIRQLLAQIEYRNADSEQPGDAPVALAV